MDVKEAKPDDLKVCRPCMVRLDVNEVSKFYLPEYDKYVIDIQKMNNKISMEVKEGLTIERVKRPTMETVKKLTREAVKRPTIEAVKRSTIESIKKPTIKIEAVNRSTIESVKKPTIKIEAVNRSTIESVKKPTIEAINTPTIESAKKPTIDTVNRPTIKKPIIEENPTMEVVIKPETAMNVERSGTSKMKESPNEGNDDTTKASLTCKLCKKKMPNYHTLSIHVRIRHRPAKYCKKCFSYFTTKRSYTNHVISQCIGINSVASSTVIYKCKYCIETFKIAMNLEKHVSLTHSEIFPINTNVEPSLLLNIGKLASVKNESKELQGLNLIVHCITCSIDVPFEEYFLRHFQDCYIKPSFVCPFCTMSKVHFPNIVDHIQRHLYVTSKICHCSECKASFLTDLNENIHSSRFHSNEIMNQYKQVESKSRMKTEIKLIGFQFLDFMTPDYVGNRGKKIHTCTRKVNSYKISSSNEETPFPPVKTSPPTDFKTDVEQVIDNLNKKNVLQNTMSVYCSVCHAVFCLETYAMHLVSCLKKPEFACPFCEASVSEDTRAEDRWGHIKLHLISLSPMTIGNGSVCVMCEELFLTEYNMALHAQFVHFL